jgi:sulfite oxidase
MTTRRSFFVKALGAVGGTFWIPARGQDREKRDMIVRSVRPEDLEMPLSGFADYLTPAEHFFVRTHVTVPPIDLSEWRLRVEGEVSAPLSLAIDDLRQFPVAELVAVLECAGNGRSFYDPPVAGLQWGNGAAGNGRWRGVRLADVLKRANIKSTAVAILFDGADVPLGTMADFQRTIPVKKALDPNTLLAYELNGKPLPVRNGFPLRAVVPGWAGDSWMKWVATIRVLDHESDGWWMKNAYRHPGKPVAPGSVLPQDAMRPLESLRVKSVIASPADRSQIEAGKSTTIRGVAWSGESGPVTNVDVSVDAGRTWRASKLTSPAARYGWRHWELAWTPPAEGYYTLLARAKDAGGDSQPFTQEWNPSGYVWNVVSRAGIEVVKQVKNSAPASESASASTPSPARFKTTCLNCHEEDVIRQQRLTRAQWDREINKMALWSPMDKGDREGILDYLSANFGPRPTP